MWRPRKSHVIDVASYMILFVSVVSVCISSVFQSKLTVIMSPFGTKTELSLVIRPNMSIVPPCYVLQAGSMSTEITVFIHKTVRVCGSVSVCLMKHPDWPVSVNQPINFQCGRAFISSPEPN